VTDRRPSPPPAGAAIACGDEVHRLRWERGELCAEDHEDLEGERALAALAGRRCACVDVIDAWRRHEDDLRVLVLASRGPADPLARLEAPGAAAGALMGPLPIATMSFGAPSRFGVSAGPAPALPPSPEDELLGLVRLGGALPDRLVAGVAASWAGRLARGEASASERAQLEAALWGRVRVAVRSWLGDRRLEVAVRMTAPGSQSELVAQAGGSVVAELPFSWLADVWSAGLATIWGRFCLGASSADGRRWSLVTVTAGLDRRETLTVELPA